jgi:xanthine dehydrogenase iron-sulfur cluster and FAD-binding subunit A
MAVAYSGRFHVALFVAAQNRWNVVYARHLIEVEQGAAPMAAAVQLRDICAVLATTGAAIERCRSRLASRPSINACTLGNAPFCEPPYDHPKPLVATASHIKSSAATDLVVETTAERQRKRFRRTAATDISHARACTELPGLRRTGSQC